VSAISAKAAFARALWGSASTIAPRLSGRVAFADFCRPPRKPTDPTAEARLIDRMSPLFQRAESHRITHPNGTLAAFVWRTTITPSKGRVLLVHGWSARAYVMGLFVDPLLKAGFDCVAIDLPGHGQSDGRQLSMPIGAEAILAVDRAIGPITAAITHSFGGTVTALAAEGGPPLTARLPALERVVFIASPNRLDAMTAAYAKRRHLPPKTHAALDAAVTARAKRPIGDIEIGRFLAASGLPALIIHDEQDEDVPFHRAETICATAPNAQLMRTKGLGHRRIVITSGVVRASVRFLGGVLPGL
jgi:pimeloyl-ACP methyl ester carboxylesterase